jgi:hypothetical protein
MKNTTKTIVDIQQEHASRAGGLLSEYQDTIGAIREQREPEDGGYLDRLTDEQRMGLLREQKTEKANEAYNDVVGAYTSEIERYHTEIAQRRGELKTRLFGVTGSEGAATLSRAALASGGELAMLMDVAATTGNTELAKAAFVVAERRGMGDLVARFFDEVDPEARELYGEWSQVPDEDVLTRQIESVERVVPKPDRLMPAMSAY